MLCLVLVWDYFLFLASGLCCFSLMGFWLKDSSCFCFSNCKSQFKTEKGATELIRVEAAIIV